MKNCVTIKYLHLIDFPLTGHRPVKLPSGHLKSDLESKHIKSKYFGKVNIWEQCEFCLCRWLYCYQSRWHVTGCLATTTTSITMICFIHYFKEVSYLGVNKTNLWKKVVSQNLLMITCIIMYNVTCCKNYLLTLPHAQLSVFKKYYISVFPKLHSCKVL